MKQSVQPIAKSLREEFAVAYEKLAEIIVDAFHYGPSPSLEEAYSESRAWFLGHYKELKPQMGAFLTAEGAGVAKHFSRTGSGGNDSFEHLFCPPTLEILMNTSESQLFRRLNETRQALDLAKMRA
ncbi:MAG: hypothetical protein MUC92_00655 [Fimbriimonadaceae bacterium]|nr:hypothetical protein [Fimbriimonadaceae bacterium]